eukprot:261562-Prymnesium_polylepis.1
MLPRLLGIDEAVASALSRIDSPGVTLAARAEEPRLTRREAELSAARAATRELEQLRARHAKL